MIPCITLLTDFGRQDTYVGQMHAVIASIAPRARVIDLTHEIEPQNVLQGAVQLANAVESCPDGTIHVAVVDPGVGSSRSAIGVRAGRWTFVAPDNGLLTLILRRYGLIETVELTNPDYHRSQMSATFHGRDLFCPVAAHLANGVEWDRLGSALRKSLVTVDLPEPQIHGDCIEAQVLWIDHFGNLVTNLHSSLLQGTVSGFAVGPHDHIPLVRCYSDVTVGALLAHVGSSGYVEIAVRNGSATAILRRTVGDRVTALIGNSSSTITSN